jgi:ADP-heptose:LPS heptosyltransferase
LNRILVIRGGAIGDFILTLPAIKALRDACPGQRVDILGHKHIASLAEKRFYADGIRPIESAELSRFFIKDADLPPHLVNYFASFDLIVSYLYDPDLIFETNLRRTGAQWIVPGPAKIQNGSHAVRQLVRPIEDLGIRIADFAPQLFPSIEDRRDAREFRAGVNPPIVAFHPGSGGRGKIWPIQNWIDLGDQLLGGFAGSLVIVSGEADQDQRRRLQLLWPSQRVRFANCRPLPELAALLEDTIFIGHDSGISHLAAAAGAKSIVLFGPTDPAVWAPLNENARVIRASGGTLAELALEPVREALDQGLI